MFFFLTTLALAGNDAVQACFPEVDACYEGGQHTQLALNMCSHRAVRVCEGRRSEWEARLGFRGSAPAFDAAVKAYEAYRKARCDLAASAWEGGSGQPLVYHSCWTAVDHARVAELSRLAAPSPAAGPSFAEADAALNTTWKAQFDGTEAMRSVQKAWLAYRDAQCHWETTWKGDDLLDPCRAALTVHRTALLAQEGEP